MPDRDNNNLSQRLDARLVKAGWFKSRDRAKEAIKAGHIKVDGLVQKKVSAPVFSFSKIEVLVPDFPFVGRAALKLKAALEQFRIDVAGKVALDIGVATGGFSDLLLSSGASKVFGVDVGEGQIDPKLLANSKFVYRNFTDARDLQSRDFDEELDLIVIDVSFISIRAFIPAIKRLAVQKTKIIVLVKPQFELGPESGRLLKNKKLVQRELEKIALEFSQAGLIVLAEMDSPVLGKEGTQEYLWLVAKVN